MYSEYELAKILKEMYNNAPQNEMVAMIHLFGIKYGSLILENNFNPKNIIEAAGMKSSYESEIRKGIKLSKYVEIKN